MLADQYPESGFDIRRHRVDENEAKNASIEETKDLEAC